MPKGRLLLFWGCGEHAPAGQPVVIDFARMAKGQVPPNLFAAGAGLPEDWQVLASNSTTYGEWPNARDSKVVKANASLLGAHKVVSTYAPEIDFTLADDFMPALQATGRDMASGAPVVNVGPLVNTMNQLGMPLYGCQTPDGYKNTQDAWLNPDALTRRIAFATALAGGRLPLAAPPAEMPAETKPAPLDPARLQATLAGSISARTQAIVQRNPDNLRAAMLLGSPDFMQR